MCTHRPDNMGNTDSFLFPRDTASKGLDEGCTVKVTASPLTRGYLLSRSPRSEGQSWSCTGAAVPMLEGQGFLHVYSHHLQSCIPYK